MYRIMSSANRDSLRFSFSVKSLLFLVFILFLQLGILKLYWIGVEKVHPFLVPNFSGSDFSFFQFSIILGIDLSYIAFIMLDIPSIPVFFRALSWRVLNFVKGFFCIYLEYHVVFVLASVYMLYYIYRFTYVEPSLHPWNETDLVMVYDLFDMLLNSVYQYFVENLCIYIH
jgi:hypothetical protein